MIKVHGGSETGFNGAGEVLSADFFHRNSPASFMLSHPIVQIVIGGDDSQHKTQLFVSLCSTSVIRALRNSIVSVAADVFICLHKS